MTRRGRLVLGVGSVLVLLLVILVSGVFRADAGSSSGDQGVATSVVVVQPGENLWQIAQQVAPGADPRETVLRIRELNPIGDAAVRPGQAIVVPMAGGADAR
ncbi:MAG: LysM peptidoglycan-binding domain-containing protein [Actinomycetales bacterium]|nr:LysM peptidoglycan-binding domain-containing protein [Actinomycetales bacterium]